MDRKHQQHYKEDIVQEEDFDEKELVQSVQSGLKKFDAFKQNLGENSVRYIMIGGLTLLLLLVCYASYIYGSAKICDDLGGILDADLVCHLDFEPQPLNQNRVAVPEEFKLDIVGDFQNGSS